MKNILLITLAIIALSGCKKEEVVGPQGPQGPQGNANVHSIEVTIEYGDWENECPGFEPWVCYVYEVSWDIIDEEMMEGGALLAYKITGTFGDSQILYEQNPVSITYSIGEIAFSAAGDIETDFDFYINIAQTQKFRIVAIAPKALALGDDHVQKLIAQELAR